MVLGTEAVWVLVGPSTGRRGMIWKASGSNVEDVSALLGYCRRETPVGKDDQGIEVNKIGANLDRSRSSLSHSIRHHQIRASRFDWLGQAQGCFASRLA